jgi:hypothetical protein
MFRRLVCDINYSSMKWPTMNDSLPSHPQATDALARPMMQISYLRDSLPEIVIGLIFLLFAAQQYLMTQWRHTGVWATWIFATIVILIWVSLILSSGRLIGWVRERCLISRYGYMKPKVSRRSVVLASGIALLIAAAFVFAMRAFPAQVVYRWLERWLPIGTGALLGVFEAAVGCSPRFLVTGTLALACGVLLAFSRLPLDLRLASFFGFVGGVALVSGTVAAARFLRASASGE